MSVYSYIANSVSFVLYFNTLEAICLKSVSYYENIISRLHSNNRMRTYKLIHVIYLQLLKVVINLQQLKVVRIVYKTISMADFENMLKIDGVPTHGDEGWDEEESILKLSEVKVKSSDDLIEELTRSRTWRYSLLVSSISLMWLISPCDVFITSFAGNTITILL